MSSVDLSSKELTNIRYLLLDKIAKSRYVLEKLNVRNKEKLEKSLEVNESAFVKITKGLPLEEQRHLEEMLIDRENSMMRYKKKKK